MLFSWTFGACRGLSPETGTGEALSEGFEGLASKGDSGATGDGVLAISARETVIPEGSINVNRKMVRRSASNSTWSWDEDQICLRSKRSLRSLSAIVPRKGIP